MIPWCCTSPPAKTSAGRRRWAAAGTASCANPFPPLPASPAALSATASPSSTATPPGTELRAGPLYSPSFAIRAGHAARRQDHAGRHKAIGVLTLYHTTRDAFTRDHLRFLKAVAGYVAPAVESALKYQDAENLAGTDHLTGIANARSLSLHLDRELSRASRDNSSIGVLLCDLNGFKQVNDRFGHLKGNQVLQDVARGLQEACRSSDYFARLGGDEFVVVVPGLKDDMCPSYLSRLETVAVEAGWAACAERLPLRQRRHRHLSRATAAIRKTSSARADERMYKAKELHKSGNGPSLLSEGAAG